MRIFFYYWFFFFFLGGVVALCYCKRLVGARAVCSSPLEGRGRLELPWPYGPKAAEVKGCGTPICPPLAMHWVSSLFNNTIPWYNLTIIIFLKIKIFVRPFMFLQTTAKVASGQNASHQIALKSIFYCFLLFGFHASLCLKVIIRPKRKSSNRTQKSFWLFGFHASLCLKVIIRAKRKSSNHA